MQMNTKEEEFEKVTLNMIGYIQTCARRFEHNSSPYDKDDFMQTAKLQIWKA
jgi:hypothetical protein